MDYLAGTGSPQVPLKEKLYYIVRVQVEMQIWERGCGEDFGDEKRQHQEHHPEQDLRCVELPQIRSQGGRVFILRIFELGSSMPAMSTTRRSG